MVAALEVLSGRLWVSPETPKACTPDGSRIVPAIGLVDAEYKVPHYSPGALGRAFGPLALDQTLVFCAALHNFLETYQQIVLTYPMDKLHTRSNAAVLIGAYLILWCQWTCSKVVRSLGSSLANLRFPCSWSAVSLSENVLSVQDCWEGLEYALRFGWLDASRLQDPCALECFLLDYEKLAYQFDGNWLAPEFIFVCADPTTTASDPNPVTFTALFPETAIDSINSAVGGTSSPNITPCTDASAATVCKTYEIEGHSNAKFGKATDFTTFLKHAGIALIVRTNYTVEPGLVCSYSARDFILQGIDHVDLPVLDMKDGLPQAEQFESLLAKCEPYLENAIALHCKGGFGRSICFAAKLMSVRFGVPGNALLGWLRIVRPGAVNSKAQEIFICSLNNKHTARSAGCDVAHPPAKCGCSVM